MKNALPLALLLLLALPLAHAASSASFSTGSTSLTENVEMDGHYGNYTLVAFSSGSTVTVAVFGAEESQSALYSEIEWLMQNKKLYTACDIRTMPWLANGQEAHCNTDGVWAGENAIAPASAPTPAPPQDNWAMKMGMATGASQERSLGAPSAAQHEIGTEQVLQLLGAFIAVLVVAYLVVMQIRHTSPALDPATEKLLDNPTRAGIMEELSSADKIPTDISAKLGKSKAAVVEHLAALSDAGLVERIATPGKKFVFYKLTQKGRQLLLRRAG